MNYDLYTKRKLLIDKECANLIINKFSITKNKSGNIKDNCIDFSYNYIAKGGQGEIYLLKIKGFNEDLAIKKGYLNENEKEILIFVSALVDSHVCPNFLLVYNIKNINKKDYILMEKINGNLNQWLEKEHTDEEWLSFLFQYLIAVYVLNIYAKTYHADLKPKNILFKNIFMELKNPYLKYNIKIDNRNYIFNVPTFNILFIIGDFGHSQSLLFKNNKISIEEIKKKIETNSDFEHIFTLIKRIKVDSIVKNYNLENILNFLKNNNINFQEYYDKEKSKIYRELNQYPKKIKDDLLLKSLAYYVIEKKIYDKMNIPIKSKLKLPSPKIQEFISKNFNGQKDSEEIIKKEFNQYLKDINEKNIIDYNVL